MKNSFYKASILFTLISIIIISYTKAAIITVDNKVTSGADHSTVQAAVDAASVGDTIYIAGSPTGYGAITVNKRLVFFGEGYNIQQDQTNFRTSVSSFNLDFVVSPSQDPSGSHFEGMDISSISGESQVNNITIERCNISGISIIGSGWTVRHNIVDNISGSGTPSTSANNSNTLIANNIIKNVITSFQVTSALVTNNIFTRNAPTSAVSGMKFTIITNNIFYNAGIGDTQSFCDRCTFTNNLTFGDNSTPFNFANNSFGNNLELTDPQFETATTDFLFEFTDDYRLKSTSPAIGAGSDGTDIGLYGGSNPYPVSVDADGFVTSLLPRIPMVTDLNIENANIPEGGTLDVVFKAKTSN